jgi:hypothetical protein
MKKVLYFSYETFIGLVRNQKTFLPCVCGKNVFRFRKKPILFRVHRIFVYQKGLNTTVIVVELYRYEIKMGITNGRVRAGSEPRRINSISETVLHAQGTDYSSGNTHCGAPLRK